jgi:exopolysaccharide biosynthesis protein
MLGGIAYALSDRYLIEHVEVAQISLPMAIALNTPTVSPAAADQNGQTDAIALTAEPTVRLDDWNYISPTLTIAISQHTQGTGSDQITYFVADVTLTDATQLLSAFAEDKFGENIIAYTSAIAQDHNALFAINGDYYGFRDDGIIIRNGVIYRDVPVRTGLAFYKDGSVEIYDETSTSAQELVDAGAWNTLSFGPALVENGQIASDFAQVEIDTNFGNHSIQGNNPRTGIGIIDANHFLFVVADGRSTGYSRGMSLTEFAQLFADYGCQNAYNIDGGGSSTMYFNGQVVNNPLGRNKERGTSDILMISFPSVSSQTSLSVSPLQ